MFGLIEPQHTHSAIDLLAVNRASLAATLDTLETQAHRWIEATGYQAEPGSYCLIPNEQGQIEQVLVGIAHENDRYALASLPLKLPVGHYRLSDAGLRLAPDAAALGWGLGAYQYTRYRKPKRDCATLVLPCEKHAVTPLLTAVYSVRDLINTPTEDMGPAELTETVRQLAVAHGAKFHEWKGDELLKDNFPTIHAVGRASHRLPRLAELTWGRSNDPHVAIVGKGVCFDTGGLDLKPADGMRWMKKDMGGAAHAIALASLIMTAQLRVRLTLLIPAVENAVAGNAYRPGEVVRTRSGITVEIDNTDAEGRLVLCDALSYAVERQPDLILDFATLTGAARVALGPELPALFSNRDTLADILLNTGQAEQDPLWRLPLWQPYQSLLESGIADIANSGASRHAGAITAALYLQRFVPNSIEWCHVDVYSWNDVEKPGRPKGGEAQSLRTFFSFLQKRYSC